MEEETKRILEMLRDGKITQEEAAMLLDALEAGEAQPRPERSARILRINVSDTRSGRTRVNIAVPFSLVEVASKLGINLGLKHAPELGDVDFDEIIGAIRHGAEGKIVDIEDDEDGQHVVVAVE